MKPELAARRDAAIALAGQGFAIGHCYGINWAGNCTCGHSDCTSPGKHGGEGWLKSATQDPGVIRARLSSGDPNYMVIPMAGSRMLVVDEDRPGALEELGPLPQTFVVHTSVKPGGARGRAPLRQTPRWDRRGNRPTSGRAEKSGSAARVGASSGHTAGIRPGPPIDPLERDAWSRPCPIGVGTRLPHRIRSPSA